MRTGTPASMSPGTLQGAPQPPTIKVTPLVSDAYIFSTYKLTKAYGPEKVVIKDVSLSFFPGAKIGVLGANGSEIGRASCRERVCYPV